MQKYMYIFFLATTIFTIQLYSFNHHAAYAAIKNQDIPTLKTTLKKTDLSSAEQRMLLSYANKVAQDYEKTAYMSSENKQSLLATSCLVGIYIGAYWLAEVMAGWAMTSHYETAVSSPLSKVLADIPKWQSIGGALCLITGLFSGKECWDGGYYTNRPRYIADYIANL